MGQHHCEFLASGTARRKRSRAGRGRAYNNVILFDGTPFYAIFGS